MIISKTVTGKHVYTSWREGREKRQTVVEFTPYFYILSSDNQPKYYNPSKFVKREFTYKEGNWHNLQGEKLTRVYVDKSDDIHIARRSFVKTFEADVPYTFRYAVDSLGSLPEYEMRKWYWDMEWQQG